MKKILTIITFIIVFASCKKETSNPTSSTIPHTCNINSTLLKDVVWHHLGGLANLKFASDGTYYENGPDGTWVLSNGCDSIYVTRPSNLSNFYYRIKSLKTDTLRLINPAFGELTYVK